MKELIKDMRVVVDGEVAAVCRKAMEGIGNG